MGLERETKRKLLNAGRRQRPAIDAQVAAARKCTQGVVRVYVEAHRIGQVEDFPGEFQGHVFADGPGFCKSSVDPKEPIPAEIVAAASITRVGGSPRRIRGNCSLQPSGFRERHGIALRVVIQAGLYRRGLYHPASPVPVRRPAAVEATQNAKWEAAGPARKAGELPAADQRLGKAVRARRKRLTTAKRKLIEPVHRDDVACVEIGRAAIFRWVPGIDDLAEGGFSADAGGCGGGSKGAGAFRIGTQVDRFRIGVAKIHLQTMAHRVAEHKLARVVAAAADGRPGIKG